jgi:hypothetical protein
MLEGQAKFSRFYRFGDVLSSRGRHSAIGIHCSAITRQTGIVGIADCGNTRKNVDGQVVPRGMIGRHGLLANPHDCRGTVRGLFTLAGDLLGVRADR